jgi:hypothetical protein
MLNNQKNYISDYIAQLLPAPKKTNKLRIIKYVATLLAGYIISAFLSGFVSAATVAGTIPRPQPNYTTLSYQINSARSDAHNARSVAFVAVGIAAIALFITAAQPSDHNPGQVRLGRF